MLNVQIEDARVIMDKENPFRSRGFGFVTFSRPGSLSSFNVLLVVPNIHKCGFAAFYVKYGFAAYSRHTSGM